MYLVQQSRIRVPTKMYTSILLIIWKNQKKKKKGRTWTNITTCKYDEHRLPAENSDRSGWKDIYPTPLQPCPSIPV